MTCPPSGGFSGTSRRSTFVLVEVFPSCERTAAHFVRISAHNDPSTMAVLLSSAFFVTLPNGIAWTRCCVTARKSIARILTTRPLASSLLMQRDDTLRSISVPLGLWDTPERNSQRCRSLTFLPPRMFQRQWTCSRICFALAADQWRILLHSERWHTILHVRSRCTDFGRPGHWILCGY